MAIETIRADPDYRGGDCAERPTPLKTAEAILDLAFNGGEVALVAKAPTGNIT